jgi:hypothetical protein
MPVSLLRQPVYSCPFLVLGRQSAELGDFSVGALQPRQWAP